MRNCCILCVVVLATTAKAADIAGRASVIDGDTLEIQVLRETGIGS